MLDKNRYTLNQKGVTPMLLIAIVGFLGIIGGVLCFLYLRPNLLVFKNTQLPNITPTPIASSSPEKTNILKSPDVSKAVSDYSTLASIPDILTIASTNWKSYQDPSGSFQFKYPSNADVYNNQTLYSLLSITPKIGLVIKPPHEAPYDKYYEFDLVVQDNPQNLDEQKIISNYIEEISKNCSPPGCSASDLIKGTLKSYHKGQINGYSFYLGAETHSAIVIQNKNRKIYLFRMVGDQSEVNEYGISVFNTILSTIAFNN